MVEFYMCGYMKIILLFFLCLGTWILQAGPLAEGTVYLKDGRSIEFQGRDRLRIPCKYRNVKGVRDAFAKTKRKEVYPMSEVDSIVCWHSRTPEYRRKFIPAEGVGWCWVYFQAPHILACVYAVKGYDIASNGGIKIWQRQRLFSRSKVAYYLQKEGDAAYYSTGRMKPGRAFRERLCRYVADDPALCARIRASNTWCDKTVLMLQEYKIGNEF